MSETKPAPAPELKTYYGNCHCGAFKFNVKLPELQQVNECNCSICFKKGYKWLYPTEGCYTVEKGEGTLKSYQFGTNTMYHEFCPKCGTAILEKKRDMPVGSVQGVNARTLRDVDIWALKVKNYAGARDREPKYVPATYVGLEPSAQVDNPKLYTGSCHCGAVTLAMKTKGPLPEGGEYIQECDCSICCRNGTTLIYPHPTQVSITNESTLSSYAFGPKTQNHKFCSTCGVSVYIQRVPLTEVQFKEWHTSEYEKWLENQAVNLRLFEGGSGRRLM